MIAYRFFDKDRGCLVSDNDDDGEKGAGAKLAALLEMADVRDVIVIVSRWYVNCQVYSCIGFRLHWLIPAQT